MCSLLRVSRITSSIKSRVEVGWWLYTYFKTIGLGISSLTTFQVKLYIKISPKPILFLFVGTFVKISVFYFRKLQISRDFHRCHHEKLSKVLLPETWPRTSSKGLPLLLYGHMQSLLIPLMRKFLLLLIWGLTLSPN